MSLQMHCIHCHPESARSHVYVQVLAHSLLQMYMPKYLWVWLHSRSAYSLSGAYNQSIYHYMYMYKCMRLLTKFYNAIYCSLSIVNLP